MKKKNLSFRKWAPILTLFLYSSLFAQIPPSPNVGALLKVQTPDVNGSTGNANITIPLYTISIDGQNLPITLNYDSRGIKIEEEAGNVGTSWSLKIGGIISREQNGIPDEYSERIFFSPSVDPNTGEIGWCQQAMINNIGQWFSKSTISNEAALYYINDRNISNFSDTRHSLYSEPDLFHYILPNGRRGSFMMNDVVNFITASNDKISATFDSDGAISSFTITDEYGDSFFFETVEKRANDVWNDRLLGSEAHNTPRSSAFKTPIFDGNRLTSGNLIICPDGGNGPFNSAANWNAIYHRPVNVSWFLSKITTHNKKNIFFNYDNEAHTTLSNTNILYNEALNGPRFVEMNKFTRFTSKRLKEIIGEEEIIKINYQTNRREDVISEPFSSGTFIASQYNLPSELRAIKSIEIFDKNSTSIRNIDFFTSYRTSVGIENAIEKEKYLYRRLWLDKIIINNIETYSFDYNNEALPYKFSYEQDYWGYFNGNNADINGKTLLPDLWFYPNDPRTYTRPTNFSIFKRASFTGQEIRLSTASRFSEIHNYIANREASVQALKRGILEKITYPTKGFVKFEYESNDFTYEGIVRKGFGLRVKNIKNFDNNNTISSSINYYYKYPYNLDISNGIITNLPVFGKIASLRNQTGEFKYQINSSSFSDNLNLYYPRTEQEFSNGDRIVTDYYIPYKIENPETLLFGNRPLNSKNIDIAKFRFDCSDCFPLLSNQPYIIPVNTYEYSTNTLTKNVDNLFGKKLREYMYNSNNELVFVLENEYISSKKSKRFDYFLGYTKELRSIDNVTENYVKSFVFSDLLLKNVRKTFFSDPNLSFVFEKSYEYDTDNLVSKETIRNSNGDLSATSYKYPSASIDYPIMEDLDEMYKKNMLNYPVTITKSTSNKTISSVFNKYSHTDSKGNYSENIFLSEIFNLETHTPLIDFTPTAWEPMLDTRMKSKKKFNKCDNKGNIQEAIVENESKSVFIWGYNKTKLIARIENSQLDAIPQTTIDNLQSLSNTDNDNCRTSNCKEEQLRVALNNLRDSLPNAMVTSYTYDPLIGVTSITNPRGETIYYIYDTQGRLKEVKDLNGNLINSNDYNYKPQ